MTGRSFAPRRPAVSRLRSSGPRKLRPEKRLGPTVSDRAPFSAMPPRRGGRAGRLPLGRDAQRLLLPASTPNAHSRASGPKNFPPPCSARRSLSARLGRDLTMAAAATPRGRPQYAAPRDEIAPSASGDREPTQPPGSAQRALTALTKARAVTRTRPPRRRAHRAFYWPAGREICHEKPSPRVPSGTRAAP